MQKWSVFLMFLFLLGCIDPIDTKDQDQGRHLVVEGSFTNLGHLNYERLSYSQPYSTPYSSFEEDALVTVSSNEGESYTFLYDAAGYYYPAPGSEASGTVGHTYTLNITIGDELYQSKPIVLREPLPIDSVHYELGSQSFAFWGDRTARLLPGYNVLVDYTDPANEKNYLRWSFWTQYEVSTQPWDFMDPETGLPAPKDCCTQCFLEEDMEKLKIIDDRLTNGRKVLNQNVLFIPFERYLGVKNKLTIYQYSTTSEAHEFFRILEQQKGSTGTVFDPPPAEVTGNVFNVRNEQEQVLGFFDVSGVTVKQVVIFKRDIPYPVPQFLYPDDCQTLRNATTQMPAGW